MSDHEKATGKINGKAFEVGFAKMYAWLNSSQLKGHWALHSQLLHRTTV
jgi:hypothetical protein